MFDEEGRKIDLETPRARDLTNLSIEELHDYIDWLGKEAERAKAEIEQRGTKWSAAEALFS